MWPALLDLGPMYLNLTALDHSLPSSKISNTDVTRLINSTEIQSIVRPAGSKHTKRPFTQKKNPLRNPAIMACVLSFLPTELLSDG